MKSDQKNPVTLEDLLRLKRAERPPAEFWPEFERELRAKQLAALVGRLPWWRTFPQRAIAGLSRYHLPLGATAVLALTFISVREYHGVAPVRGFEPAAAEEVAPAVAPSTAEEVAGNDGRAAVAALGPNHMAERSAEIAVAGNVEESPAIERPSLAGDVSAMNALVGGVAPSETERTISLSGRSIADNFAAVQAEETPLQRSLLGAQRGFEARMLPARAIDPLAQVTPPSDVRRSRYLGTALPASLNNASPSGRSTGRLVSQISDDRLYESISRFGFGGDRVSLMVKF